jgi:hypothetical protein
MQDGQGDNAMGMASMMREVQELAEKFKVEEDEQYISPYAQLEKATVLQEARYVGHLSCLSVLTVLDCTGLYCTVLGIEACGTSPHKRSSCSLCVALFCAQNFP